jgi:quercetin dioxygenase-like cupin family protein
VNGGVLNPEEAEDVQSRVVRSVEGLPVRGRITMRVLITGAEILLLEACYEAGAGTELHRHGHESLCYVVRGRMRTTLGDDSWELGPGEWCLHPIGVGHTMEAVEESVVLEIKSPPPDPAGFLSLD